MEESPETKTRKAVIYPREPDQPSSQRFIPNLALLPSLRSGAVTIVQPDTVLRWHLTGFRLYWRWKSRSRGGRPKVPIEVRSLIRSPDRAKIAVAEWLGALQLAD